MRRLAALGTLLLATTLAAASVHDGDERFTTDREGAAQVPLSDEAPSFSFAVFGDRTGGPRDGVRVLAQAVEDVNAIGPDLVMTVGDLVQGYGAREAWLEQMREYKAIMAGLECAWFPVAGNHDTYWEAADAPPGGHDADYEEHFGPLWYAFRHKTAWFVVLYSDEGDPETGKKDFSNPACQRISDEQMAWLDATLERAADAEHVFVFLHHPRWKGGRYGDDWQRVHARLVAAGNVSAVFAGHIHTMTYDGVRDGIEYFTLATVGAFNEGDVPGAGYLHQFHLVTVRAGRLDVASIPVGEVTDPRTVTSEVGFDAQRVFDQLVPRFEGVLAPCMPGSATQSLGVTLRNPVDRPLEVTLSLANLDPRRPARPDHVHHLLDPRGEWTVRFDFLRTDDARLDAATTRPELAVRSDYLGDGLRVAIPERRFPVPVVPAGLTAPPEPAREHALRLDGTSCAVVPSERLDLPDGPFTLEARVTLDALAPRLGVVSKTEGSEFGLFAGDGKPTFFVHLGGRYAVIEPQDVRLEPGRTHHLAGVFDGAELRLYVDGRLVGRRAATGARGRNALPLVIGGDVDKEGAGASLMQGTLDEVRLSRVARYAGESVTPPRRHAPDADTALLLHMDAASGPFLHDASPAGAHAELRGAARVEPE